MFLFCFFLIVETFQPIISILLFSFQITARFKKESEQAVKAKENLVKDLNRASSDVNRDRELLQQQLEELKVQ